LLVVISETLELEQAMTVERERGWRTSEVAALFHVRTSTVTRWVREGRVHPADVPGHHYLIPNSEVLRLYKAAKEHDFDLLDE
jgi:excisionase family DNA binding protein